MAVKPSVFASKSERENFKKLSRTWGDKYLIYHNLPYLNIFSPKNLCDYSDWMSPKPFTLNDIDFNRLKKTSVDFTLCDYDDKPIICIEYDGLQQGFNIGTSYRPKKLMTLGSDWRSTITELKLQVAHGSLFPYFVLNSKQFNDISQEVKLTITDGIIGEVISNMKSRDKFSQGFDPLELDIPHEVFDNLSPEDQHEIIQNWVFNIELENEYENNPISIMVAKLSSVLKITSHSYYPLEYPEPKGNLTVEERIIEFNNVIGFGKRVVVESSKYGSSTGEAWLPNFKTPGYSGFGLLDEIAELMALEKMRRSNNITL